MKREYKTWIGTQKILDYRRGRKLWPNEIPRSAAMRKFATGIEKDARAKTRLSLGSEKED